MDNSLLSKILTLRNEHFQSQHSLTAYDYQVEVSDGIIKALVDNLLLIRQADPGQITQMQTLELPVEFARQSGKTTAIVHTVEFVMLWFPTIFDQPIAIGLFAPQKEQAKTDFDRLKNLLLVTQQKLIVTDEEQDKRTKEENNARTVAIANGASCFIAPVTKQSKSESKTFHLMLFEEAQDINDEIMTGDIFPMAASTNAPRVIIGTAGIKECYFKQLVDNSPLALIYRWQKIAADRRKTYEQTGDPFHLMYEQFVKNEIAKYPKGEQDDAIRRPYNLEWITEVGMFVLRERLFACRIEHPYDLAEQAYPHFFGIDQAKHVDKTVLKVGRVIDDKLTIVKSFSMNGVDYPSQFDALQDVLGRFRVAAGAIDSTGQGDWMPDMFNRHTRYHIFPVVFTGASKDEMYKSLDALIATDRFRYYWSDDNLDAKEFEGELLELEREYKTDKYYLSVHHPDRAGAHDDHADATALMVYAYEHYNSSSGIYKLYSDMASQAPSRERPLKPTEKRYEIA